MRLVVISFKMVVVLKRSQYTIILDRHSSPSIADQAIQEAEACYLDWDVVG